MRHRQHRYIGVRVFLLAIQRQRPEVGRRPDKNNEHQQQRIQFHGVCDGRPAEQRRQRPEQATDHRILRCRAFQIEGVEQTVAHPGDQVQPRGQRIDQEVQHEHPRNPRNPAERDARGKRDPALHHGPVAGARHARIDPGIRDVIHGGSGPGHQRDADERVRHGRQVR